MGYRSIEFQITNSILDENLIIVHHSLEHGKWNSTPVSIRNNNSITFKVESKDAALIGVEGKVIWENGTTLEKSEVYFNKPMSTNPTSIDVTVGKGYKYTLSGDPQGHNSKIGIVFSKI